MLGHHLAQTQAAGGDGEKPSASKFSGIIQKYSTGQKFGHYYF